MKLKSILSCMAVAMLIIVAFSIPHARATPSVNLASLPNCTTETGMFYGGGTIVWQPCYDTGILYKEDYATSPATLTSYDIHSAIGTFNAISMWGDASNLYVIGRGGNGIAGVVKAPVSNPLSTTTPVSGLALDVLYPDLFGGNLYIPDGAGVAKFNTGAGTFIQINTGVAMFQCTDDGTNIFCTAYLAGQVWKIDSITNIATMVVSGLSHPYGIAAGGGFVYVAQNTNGQVGATGSVIKIAESDWMIKATSALQSGASPYGVMLLAGFVITDSDGPDQTARNVYVLNTSNLSTQLTISCPVLENGQCRTTSILISDGTNIFVGFQGSAGTAEISNWQQAVTTSWNGATLVFNSNTMTFIFNGATTSVIGSTSTTSTTTTSSGCDVWAPMWGHPGARPAKLLTGGYAGTIGHALDLGNGFYNFYGPDGSGLGSYPASSIQILC